MIISLLGTPNEGLLMFVFDLRLFKYPTSPSFHVVIPLLSSFVSICSLFVFYCIIAELISVLFSLYTFFLSRPKPSLHPVTHE